MYLFIRYVAPGSSSQGWTWQEAKEQVTSSWSLLEVTDAALHSAATEQMQEKSGIQAWTAGVGAYTYPLTAWRWLDCEYEHSTNKVSFACYMHRRSIATCIRFSAKYQSLCKIIRLA